MLLGYPGNPAHAGAMLWRGFFSILFAIVAFAWPGATLLSITLLFGAYAFVDGIFAVYTGLKAGGKWAVPVVEGVLGIAAGLITFFWPGLTLLVLSILVGAWAIATGALEIYAAFSGHPAASSKGARAVLAIAGLLSLLLGVLIWIVPALGAVTLLSLVAIYSLFFGILFISLGLRARQAHRGGETSATAA